MFKSFSVSAGTVALCLSGAIAITEPAQAQSAHTSSAVVSATSAANYSTAIHDSIIRAVLSAKARQHRNAKADLLPLTSRHMAVTRERVGLIQVSNTLNERIEQSRHAGREGGIQLDSIPIVGDLLDDAGNLDIGINLPFDVSIDDVMGETGLVLSTDFTVD